MTTLSGVYNLGLQTGVGQLAVVALLILLAAREIASVAGSRFGRLARALTLVIAPLLLLSAPFWIIRLLALM